MWRRRFGADPQILGRMLTLNAEPYTVIGVAARGFAFPRGSEMPGDFQFAATPDLWVPLKPPTDGITDLAIVGRLRRASRTLAAREDMDRVMAVVQTFDPCHQEFPPRRAARSASRAAGRRCGGDAHQLARRGAARPRDCVREHRATPARAVARGAAELAVRAALGASTRRLAGEVLTDVPLLVAVGGAAGSPRASRA